MDKAGGFLYFCYTETTTNNELQVELSFVNNYRSGNVVVSTTENVCLDIPKQVQQSLLVLVSGMFLK